MCLDYSSSNIGQIARRVSEIRDAFLGVALIRSTVLRGCLKRDSDFGITTGIIV